MTVNNEMEFIEWFENQTHDGGKPYKDNTQINYVKALKNISKEMSSKILPYESIFNISDVKELERIIDIINNDENGAKLLSKSNGTGIASLKRYKYFLEQENNDDSTEKINDCKNSTSKYSLNRIIFGAPGTGKSNKLARETKGFASYERVTFHPDYTYANFVGCYKPIMVRNSNGAVSDTNKEVVSLLTDNTKSAQEKYDLLYEKFKNDGLTRLPILLGLYTDEVFKTRKLDGTDAVGDNSVERNHGKALRPYVALFSDVNANEEIAYRYVPGPFTRILVKALQDPEHAYLLLIEEINRANVAAVFGDVFQLLDRNEFGKSEYPIQISEDMKQYLQEKLNGFVKDTIELPSNLYIWATMNSADQGVYPMDTAFKRRWDFEYIDIDNKDEKINDFWFNVAGKQYHWNSLRKAINDQLTEIGINEDKLMGAFFVSKHIIASADNDKFIKAFCNKVIMYLFEDAARQKHSKIFDLGNGKVRYSKLCADFYKKGISVFVTDIVEKYEDFVKGVVQTIDKQPVEQIESSAE